MGRLWHGHGQITHGQDMRMLSRSEYVVPTAHWLHLEVVPALAALPSCLVGPVAWVLKFQVRVISQTGC